MPPNVLRYGWHPDHWRLDMDDVTELADFFAVQAEIMAERPDEERQQQGAEQASAEAARVAAEAEKHRRS